MFVTNTTVQRLQQWLFWSSHIKPVWQALCVNSKYIWVLGQQMNTFYILYWADETENNSKEGVFLFFFAPPSIPFNFATCFLLSVPFPHDFPPFSLSSSLPCLCVSFPFLPLCEDRWCMCLWKTEHLQWNWFSVEKLMDYFVFLTGVGDCLCHTDKYVYTHKQKNTHTHSSTCRGERTRGLFMLKPN